MASVPAAAIVPVLVRDFGLPVDPRVLQMQHRTANMQAYIANETLDDVIYNISPTDTPFMSVAQLNSVSPVHEWRTDKLVPYPAGWKGKLDQYGEWIEDEI